MVGIRIASWIFHFELCWLYKSCRTFAVPTYQKYRTLKMILWVLVVFFWKRQGALFCGRKTEDGTRKTEHGPSRFFLSVLKKTRPSAGINLVSLLLLKKFECIGQKFLPSFLGSKMRFCWFDLLYRKWFFFIKKLLQQINNDLS